MAVERRNPLPAGRYWVNIPPGDVLPFNVWKTAHRETVKVDTVSTGDDGWEFHIFRVLTPVIWGPWGFPNIAGDDVDGPEDTYTAPTIEQPEPAALMKQALWGVAGIVLAAVAINRILR